MKILDVLIDKRTQCISVLANMKLEQYKYFAENAFNNNGNIEGQRAVIKRSSVAAKIRNRMQIDFDQGAIFPPVVMGVLLDIEDEEFKGYLNDVSSIDFETKLPEIGVDEISIIDGMQRTNIYFSNLIENMDREVHVEFWISNSSIKLLYRMLVLNTGQVPWNTRRQMELVYSSLAANISDNIIQEHPELKDKIIIMGIDDNTRRTTPGSYSKSNVIEMYLGFNMRNVKVNTSDELADEFQRFDMLESVDKNLNFVIFTEVISYLCKIDFGFSEFTTISDGQFSSGKDIFTSLPACLGFVVASAEFIFGKTSTSRSDEKIQEYFEIWKKRMNEFLKLMGQTHEKDFLKLETLSEIIDKLPKSKIGDEMRRLFKNAFSELIRYEEIEEIDNLESFWRS